MTGKDLEQQIINISKASAYDTLRNYVTELKQENQSLRDRIEHLENIIKEYCDQAINILKP
jgi:predicted  nucleic acid-binding Zn-ribbon protein